MTRADIEASVPLLEPPGWALAERELFDLLDHAWRRFARDFTGPDGRLNYRHALTSRDGVDDFYEVFFNWPQLYLLGGSDDLLAQAERHWEGVTAQLTELDMLKDEYERGYDWFHQGESLLLLYFLTMANPARWAERAVRFAELYVDPAHGNYDPARRIIRRPHNGSDPGRTGLFDGTHYPWLDQEARCYGFPLDWLEPDGAPEPERAQDRRLAGEMTARMGAGDTAVNLAAAGLVLNAWILTGDPRYRDWIEQYVGAWRERAAANDGIMPDNAGPDGVVGSLLGGRWYGGHYGWSWPHGWYSVGSAAAVAALAAATATGDDGYLDLLRPALDALIARGKVMAFTESDSSLSSKWYPQLAEAVAIPTMLVPFRHSDRGWFDYNPMLASVPVALWHHGGNPADRRRLEELREASRIRLADRPLLPQQGGSRPRRALVRVPGRRQPGLPREDPRRRPGPGTPPARPHAGPPRHRRNRGRHPPVAAVQPGRHRGPGPADVGRPAGDLQRGTAAGQGPLLRRQPAPPRPARLGSRPGLEHRPAGHRRRPG